MNKSKPVNDYYEPRMDPATTNDGIVKKFWRKKNKKKSSMLFVTLPPAT